MKKQHKVSIENQMPDDIKSRLTSIKDNLQASEIKKLREKRRRIEKTRVVYSVSFVSQRAC